MSFKALRSSLFVMVRLQTMRQVEGNCSSVKYSSIFYALQIRICICHLIATCVRDTAAKPSETFCFTKFIFKFCDHCENRNSVFSLIVSHNSLEVVLVHGRAELGVAAWLPLSLCYLPAVYTEAAQRELHLFELECDCSYTGAAGEGMMLFHHCPPLPQTLTACTHTHTLLWTPVSATQPVNLRERETGRGGGVLKWGIGRHFLRNAGSYQKWHVTVSAVRSQALSLLCCWLLPQSADASCLNLRASLGANAPSCILQEHSDHHVWM